MFVFFCVIFLLYWVWTSLACICLPPSTLHSVPYTSHCTPDIGRLFCQVVGAVC